MVDEGVENISIQLRKRGRVAGSEHPTKVSQNRKKVDTFIYIIRLRVAYPVLGMVRFRRSTSFCDGRGWVVLTSDYDE